MGAVANNMLEMISCCFDDSWNSVPRNHTNHIKTEKYPRSLGESVPKTSFSYGRVCLAPHRALVRQHSPEVKQIPKFLGRA